MATAEDITARAEGAVEAWNAKDLDTYFGFFHPEVVFHGPKATGESRGVGALRKLCTQLLDNCPNLTITTKVLVVDPERQLVASVQDESGTTVSGDHFAFESMAFMHVDDDGLVDEVWEQFEIRP